MKQILFLLVLLAFAFFVFCIALAGCASDPTPEEFVISKLKENLHDPKSLEVISIMPSELGAIYKYLWGESQFTKLKSKELANGDPFIVFHIQYRATNVYRALRKQEAYIVYGYGVVTNSAISDDLSLNISYPSSSERAANVTSRPLG